VDELEAGRGLALRAGARLLYPAAVDLDHQAVRAHEAAEVGVLQVRDDRRATHHHALDAQQLVDVLRMGEVTDSVEVTV
jgi:hypothetical protein